MEISDHSLEATIWPMTSLYLVSVSEQPCRRFDMQDRYIAEDFHDQ